MTTFVWGFDGVCDERRLALHLPFGFTTLIDSIRSEASSVRYVKEKGTHEARGSWRAVFRFDVRTETFDLFFNSPYGYRGWYLTDPSEGQKRNEVLISALVETLCKSFHGSAESLGQVRSSLRSPYAKIWIDEDQHDPQGPELIIQIRMPQWERAARAVHKRLVYADPTITTKELDRIYGVRAPTGKTLKVMGAWIALNGALGVVRSKLLRGEDIQSFGVS